MIKYNIKHYWSNKEENAEKARLHTADMNNKFSKEIKYSIDNTVMFTKSISKDNNTGNNSTNMIVEDITSSDAVFKYNSKKSCLLNFASYKHPGGRFLDGSIAQEEAICHDSILYNVLSSNSLANYYEYNNAHKNKGLYEDRALYSPKIVFETNNGNTIAKCDVLTCASPNRSILEKGYNSFTEEDNDTAMKNRVKFIKDIMEYLGTDTAILGAWGCGVFAQDPKKVAKYMVNEFGNSNIKNVVFAVPKGKNSANYDAFKETVDNYYKKD